MYLSLTKSKVAKEYIYVKKHSISLYSLEEVSAKFNKSKDKVSEIVNFFVERINYEKLKFVTKMICNEDGKYKPNVNQIKTIINELLINAVEDFLNNPIDSIYVTENIILTVSIYNGKHYISIAPRLDFSK